jgi:hypothetical protein
MIAPFPGKPKQAKFGFYGQEMIEKEVKLNIGNNR